MPPLVMRTINYTSSFILSGIKRRRVESSRQSLIMSSLSDSEPADWTVTESRSGAIWDCPVSVIENGERFGENRYGKSVIVSQ